MGDERIKRKLGFVGLGRMGGGMAVNIAKRADNLMLYDISTATRAEFESRHHVAESLEEILNHAEVLLLSLPTSQDVEEVTDRFVASGVEGKVVIDLSTSYPFSTIELYGKMKQAGGAFLDSPLSGGPQNAADGTLNVMVGGDREVYDAQLSIYRTFSKNVFYVGKAGSANITKLAGNFISILYTALYAEILPFVEKLGVDPQILFDIVSVSGSNCGIFQLFAPKMIKREFPISFQLALADKDLGYMKRLFEEEKLPSSMLDAGLELFEKARKMDIMQGDTGELVRVTRNLYGMKP